MMTDAWVCRLVSVSAFSNQLGDSCASPGDEIPAYYAQMGGEQFLSGMIQALVLWFKHRQCQHATLYVGIAKMDLAGIAPLLLIRPLLDSQPTVTEPPRLSHVCVHVSHPSSSGLSRGPISNICKIVPAPAKQWERGDDG